MLLQGISPKVANAFCHNPSLGLVTKTRACKVVGQKGSPGVTFHAPESAKEFEGMNLRIPNGLPNLQRAISGVKTIQFEKKFISLESY
jgi:hypothetical protein